MFKARYCFIVAALLFIFIGAFTPTLTPAFGVSLDVAMLNIGPGYSAVDTNAMPFRSYSVLTQGDYQFVSYYGTNQTINIARRQLGSTSWSIFNTSFTAKDITDDHDMISMALDGDGIMHLSWGMHVNPLKYTTSTASVLNNNPIGFYSSRVSSMPLSTVGGNQNSITYPQFYNIPGSNGDLLFCYRSGTCGNGDLNFNRYSTATDTWSVVKAPVIDGLSANEYAYPNTLVLGSPGKIQMSWTWRVTSDYQTNHDICYGQSTDGGITWTSITGAPINSGSTAMNLNSPNQTVASIPTHSSLMNQTSMTADIFGRPLIATYWAPGGSTNSSAARQYMLTYYDGTQWRNSQITNRPSEPRIDNNDATRIREMGRPIVMVDQDNRTLVVMRYTDVSTTNPNNPSNNHITVAYSMDKQNWSLIDLTPTTDMGQYEPSYDLGRWQQNGVLDLFYQQVPSGSSTMVSLLEWNARSYFITNTIWDWGGGNASGAANSAANWKVNTYSVSHAPSGAGYNFRFGNESAANNVVDITSAGLTVGNITFTASTGTTIQSTGGYSLTLDNSGSDSTISVVGTHTISAPVLMDNDVNVSGTGTLNLSGGISGSHMLDVLSGNVTAKNILVNTLTIGSGATITIQAIPGGPTSRDITPVPEPTIIFLLLAGAVFFLASAWRRGLYYIYSKISLGLLGLITRVIIL